MIYRNDTATKCLQLLAIVVAMQVLVSEGYLYKIAQLKLTDCSENKTKFVKILKSNPSNYVQYEKYKVNNQCCFADYFYYNQQ
jgi:hypothetical protein